MSAAPRVAVVVVAAGSGSRIGDPSGLPKQYRAIGGEPVLRRTLGAFLGHAAVGPVVVVIGRDHRAAYDAAVGGLDGLAEPVTGGADRQASVRLGLEALAETRPDFVLIHDAARPFVSAALIDRCVAALRTADAILAAVPVVDTLKRADAAGRVVATTPRDGLFAAQTPQGFRFDAILAAHRAAAAAGVAGLTDDAAVAEWAGMQVAVVPGESANMKITTGEDLAAADRRLAQEAYLALGDVRVGTGYDVHRFTEGDAVVLGGVRIPHSHKLDGHSDADVALHALTDAILGTIGEGDIGALFPPSDAQWRGADSAIFLKEAARRVAARGGVVAHADVNLIAEAPKIGPHREAMRARIAAILGIDRDRVGVKATTNEKMGFVGRREGIAAIATATVRLPFGR
jgi:2-C-methyl-D-erythritol 4-phosphate cytidylyltransferase/2-C-methyl-D-erythritol 2,4-cyclodiphosphate synthase